ncbi:hypothetical protein, partial [Shinella pollutisoli]|uniref:hypothetical protein n=1 Tax=Shinella pollutisoli TaxID=2250594 RepID=UPI002148CB76
MAPPLPGLAARHAGLTEAARDGAGAHIDRALLRRDDREVRIDLLQPDRRRRPAGPAPTITTSNSMSSERLLELRERLEDVGDEAVV